jgi:hypothetical protein
MKFCSIIARRNSFVFLFLLLLSFSVRAQVSTSSPYSRYGIGDLQFGGFSKNLGMGGLAFGVSQPFNINYSNPATYSSLVLTTFEAAGRASMYELYTSSSAHAYQYNADFGYLAMGFPLKTKKWGLSFGLLPYSSVGYDISDKKLSSAGIEETHLYEGSGGLNQFYVGTGFLLGKNLFAGVNAAFLFGTINQVRRVEFTADGFYNTKVKDETIVNDFYFNAGLLKTFDSLSIAKSDSIVMYDRKIEALEDSIEGIHKRMAYLTAGQAKDSVSSTGEAAALAAVVNSLSNEILIADSARELVSRRKQKSAWSLSIGLTGSPSLSLRAKHTLLSQNYYYINEIEYLLDTAGNRIEDQEGKLVLPFCVGLGFTLHEGNHWTAGADFSIQNWQDYSLFGEQDSLANSWRVGGGFQWTPNDRSIKSYFSLIQYRLGAHFEQTYLQLRNSQLTDYGVSLGFGFPMKRVATTVQLALEAGKRGTISNNLVEMNYVKCTIGFTLNDRWFIKQKFD